ncbi:MAG: hypothetical protein HYS18_17065 [Burkholderiales bacterium]|nr:hypothetical protein [Burkholderiales bacterium]
MQEVIVAVVVCCAAMAVLKRYLPRAARNAVRQSIARIAGKLGWQRMAHRLEAEKKIAASCDDGCGSCGGCGAPSSQPAEKRIFIRKL